MIFIIFEFGNGQYSFVYKIIIITDIRLITDTGNLIFPFANYNMNVHMAETGLEKETIKANAYRMVDQDENGVKYECDFEVGEDFGEIGAVFVANEHNKEMHLKTIALEGLFNGNVNLNCNSWVARKDAANQEKRVFFTNKVSNIYTCQGNTIS